MVKRSEYITLPGWVEKEETPVVDVAVPTPSQVAMQAMAQRENNATATLYRQQIAQAEHEWSLMKRVPEMKVQAKLLESRLWILKRCVKAAEAGFAEFRPAQSWDTGYMSAPSGGGYTAKGGYKLYTRAIPVHAIIAFQTAKDLKVFDHYSIHSPDASAFKTYAPVEKPKDVDPVLVGWINTAVVIKDNNFTGHQQNTEADVIHPFLIAAWDLGADLAVFQQQLAAPKEVAVHNHRAGSSCPITCPMNPYF